VLPKIAQRKSAALKIQTMFRGYQARQMYKCEREQHRQAELETQRLAEVERQRQLNSALKIQKGKQVSTNTG